MVITRSTNVDLVLAFTHSMVMMRRMEIHQTKSQTYRKRRITTFLGWIALFLVILSALPVSAATALMERARQYYQEGQFIAAHKELNKISLEDQDPKRMALVHTFRGLIFFEQKKFSDSIAELKKGIRLGTRLSDVSYYYLGMAYRQMGDQNEAIKALKRSVGDKMSDYLKWQVELEMAKIYFEQNQHSQARPIFNRVKAKLKGSDDYPEVIYSLLKIDLAKNQMAQACYWARDLYKNHPTFDPIAQWGLQWQNNKVDGRVLACNNSMSDQMDRIKRLQWVGASDKAFSELKVFESSDASTFIKDMAMAEYLVNEGMVSEAFQRLIPYYKDKKNKEDYDYISLLAKAASRAGEYQTAIGIYMEAYNTFAGSKKQGSLYRAAFLSYQHKDYDSAVRKFSQLLKNHPYSSLAKQSNWYLPWVYYLKGNYEKSYELLSQNLKDYRRRVPHSVSRSKLKYWMAMNQKRLGHSSEAQKLFLEVAHDEDMGYYSIAAIQRLKELVGTRGLANIQYNKASGLRENWLPHFKMEEQPGDSIEKSQTLISKTNTSYFSEWEKLPYMREYLDMNQPSHVFSRISKPEFRLKIERAKDMGLLGLSELAKWELYSIEGRTKDEEYLKTLMFEYHRNQVYHRAAYIGTRHFAGVRAHLGLHLGASIWHFVFPRAFEADVLQSSARFGVPPEFIWSIMKAETNFRPDALSPVGAKGLMQVMTHTGRKVASLMGQSIEGQDLFNPQVGIEIGTSYLKRNLKKFKDKIPLAAAAYNGGPHRVHTWLHQFGDLDMDEFIEHIPFLETRNYVKKVSRYYTIYQLLYNKNAHAAHWLAENVDVQMEGTPPTKETWEVL
jgi:soluble lytic murein transglycosylase